MAVATVTAGPAPCTPPLVLDSATASGATAVTVVLECTGSGRNGLGKANVTVFFNGRSSWTGVCTENDTNARFITISVTGLNPGTTYAITGTVSTVSGVRAADNSLSVTTPAN